ncbi:MAG: hypothetical protein LBR61_11750 [Synergistaceae bacterium]|jgi:hypothetical protein|nr:hypothetical protein [Synergistaceae bacterium]
MTTRFRAFARAVCAILLLCLSLCSAEAALKRGKLGTPQKAPEFQPEPLPRQGTVAVLVRGPDPQHDAVTAGIVAQRLIAGGYKVVDQKKMAEMRRSEAARLALEQTREAQRMALEGNIDGIMGLDAKYGRAIRGLASRYGVETVVTIDVSVDGDSRRNEFDMFTGTASAAVMAVSSGGRVLYSDTVSGRQVGYTRGEAERNAVEAAATTAADRMAR